MKLVIGGVAQGKLDYVLENMIEKTEKYDVYNSSGCKSESFYSLF